jgi:hypothetical protein
MSDLPTLSCVPVPNIVAEEMLQNISRALCFPAEATPEQNQSLTRQLVYTTLSFEPRDGLEIQLSTMVYGHCGMIFDSMKDVYSGLTPMEKLRIKRNIVDMDQKLLALLREYRAERERPLAKAHEIPAPEAEDETEVEAQAPEPEAAPGPEAEEPMHPSTRAANHPHRAAATYRSGRPDKSANRRPMPGHQRNPGGHPPG